MTSIRIAVATALAVVAVFAGGSGQVQHIPAPARTHTAVLASAPLASSPPLCCWA